MDSISNFRELGGLVGVDGRRVRHGQIFRSGHLADASDDDVARLAEFGIASVIDLRSAEDLAAEGADRVPDDVRVHHVPTFDDAGRAADIRALIMSGDEAALDEAFGGGRARDLALLGAQRMADADDTTERFRTAMALVLDPTNRPLVVHCSAGKDRAGWMATVIAMALGVDRPQLIEHYLESNRHNRTLEQLRGIPRFALAMPLVEVHADYIEAALASVDERWGSVDGYLRDGLHIDDAAIDRFRADLLT